MKKWPFYTMSKALQVFKIKHCWRVTQHIKKMQPLEKSQIVKKNYITFYWDTMNIAYANVN